jgi:hypothetical protein
MHKVPPPSTLLLLCKQFLSFTKAPDAYYALLSAALHPLQLVKYHIVPSCIGYYSTFRPSMPPVLVVNSAATVSAPSSTAVVVSGAQTTQFATTSALQPGLSQLVVQDSSQVQVSTPAGTFPTRQPARQVATRQDRSWVQPGSYTTYTVAKPGHMSGQGQVRLPQERLRTVLRPMLCCSTAGTGLAGWCIATFLPILLKNALSVLVVKVRGAVIA